MKEEYVGYNSKEDALSASGLLRCEHKRRDITCEYCNIEFTQKCRRDALEQKISRTVRNHRNYTW